MSTIKVTVAYRGYKKEHVLVRRKHWSQTVAAARKLVTEELGLAPGQQVHVSVYHPKHNPERVTFL